MARRLFGRWQFVELNSAFYGNDPSRAWQLLPTGAGYGHDLQPLLRWERALSEIWPEKRGRHKMVLFPSVAQSVGAFLLNLLGRVRRSNNKPSGSPRLGMKP